MGTLSLGLVAFLLGGGHHSVSSRRWSCETKTSGIVKGIAGAGHGSAAPIYQAVRRVGVLKHKDKICVWLKSNSAGTHAIMGDFS